MSAPSISVQFNPFRLRLDYTEDRLWIATLSHQREEGVPLVVSTNAMPPSVSLETGVPRLQLGNTGVLVPAKQLQRIRNWVSQQHPRGALHDRVTASDDGAQVMASPTDPLDCGATTAAVDPANAELAPE